jgi:hypothetical protein
MPLVTVHDVDVFYCNVGAARCKWRDQAIDLLSEIATG